MPTSASSGHPGETDEMVKMEISSLAVIGLPPSTFSRDRHRRLDTHCAMVGRRDKKRSVSFSLDGCYGDKLPCGNRIAALYFLTQPSQEA